jgi:hypothetical protein
MQVRQQQAQTRSFDEGNSEINFRRSADRLAEVRQERVVATGNQPARASSAANRNGVDPLLLPAGPSICVYPAIKCVQARQSGQPRPQGGFVDIRVVATSVLPLSLADLEAEVERSARLERRPQTLQRHWDVGRGKMKKAGASPDTVVESLFGNVRESLDGDGLLQMACSQFRQTWRSIKGNNPVVARQERLGITP